MRSMLAAVLVLVCLIIPARADWPVDKMNQQIEQTNVIVSEICSGTIVDVVERLVLTAYHCVADSLRDVEKKEVDPKTGEVKTKTVQEKAPMFIETWKYQDYEVVTSEKHTATIVGKDEATDTALLQVDDLKYKPEAAAPMAGCDYKFERGKLVYAVGNPGILFDNSITSGIISAPERKLDFGTGKKIPLFQHSANTIGGNSGGAIYNGDGQMIGTVTGGVRGADISLAVPICFAQAMIRAAGFGKILEKQ
mgnify:CR=1 FL=1|jgi:S1-C subfamily serine protease|tara:strand:- start:275 stop:1027 length:753 start_codon:yes stop_codon:yes gene_type:complete